MLYILNKPGLEALRQLAVIGADDDEKAVLLISDGVFLGNETQLERFESMGVDDVYAAEDAVAARGFELAPDVEVVDYDDMAGLFEEHDKIVML